MQGAGQTTALVTGGSGFIGSCVIRALGERGVKARALLRSTSSRSNLEGAQYEAAPGSLSDIAALERASAGVDYVFHLAGSVAANSRREYFEHNAEGTANLASAAAKASPGLKRFVYVSSLAAGGPSAGDRPRDERDDDAPISAYGQSKREGEARLRAVAEKERFGVTVVRPPAVYGPRDKGVFEFVKLVNSGLLLKFPARTKTREKYLSVIHVEDLVAGIVEAGLGEGQENHEIFYLSGDGIYTWTQVFEAMARALGKSARSLRVPKPALVGLAAMYTGLGAVTRKQFPLTLDKLKDLEPDFWTCSNEKAKRKIGFSPRFGLDAGIRNTVQWYLENGWL